MPKQKMLHSLSELTDMDWLMVRTMRMAYKVGKDAYIYHPETQRTITYLTKRYSCKLMDQMSRALTEENKENS